MKKNIVKTMQQITLYIIYYIVFTLERMEVIFSNALLLFDRVVVVNVCLTSNLYTKLLKYFHSLL